jgi:ATP-binding cassette subfamily B protein
MDFTLTVEPGETVALVGPSGAGKSTIFQLAERFYDPQMGTVRIDGVPLTSADPAGVRRRMALVPQEAILFAANADGFLRARPDGLDTVLGDGDLSRIPARGRQAGFERISSGRGTLCQSSSAQSP